MEGYVRNISRTWRHALKRSVAPGQKIELDVLYAEYGEKHDLAEGRPFANWLRTVKLKDAGTWEIYYKDEVNNQENEEELQQNETELVVSVLDVAPVEESSDSVSPFVEKKYEAMDIVNFSVRQARDELSNIVDVKLLKNAMRIAKTQTGKDTLTNMLRKRLREVEVFARR